MLKNINTQARAETKDLKAQLKESNAAIYDLTYFDPITKLPNRKKLIDQFNEKMETNQKTMERNWLRSLPTLYRKENNKTWQEKKITVCNQKSYTI